MTQAETQPVSIAVWKFASCDGCQLSLLDCEDELLALADRVNIAHFLEASKASVAGPYDVSIVEGSITTPGDLDRIRQIRDQSTVVVAIGACATAGGIQALRNFANVAEFTSIVYAKPEYVSTLATSTPASAHIHVDVELAGCPIDRRQLLDTITALIIGRKPALPGHSVCFECKIRGNTCVLVANGTPCLGPVTRAGCGALCPSYARGCYGCFGPAATTNTESLVPRLQELGMPVRDISRVFSTFNVAAPPFTAAAATGATAPGPAAAHPAAPEPISPDPAAPELEGQ